MLLFIAIYCDLLLLFRFYCYYLLLFIALFCGQERLEAMQWRDAAVRAEGGRVFDDPKLLKRHAKADNKIKVQRAKAWKEREDKVEQQKEERKKK